MTAENGNHPLKLITDRIIVKTEKGLQVNQWSEVDDDLAVGTGGVRMTSGITNKREAPEVLAWVSGRLLNDFYDGRTKGDSIFVDPEIYRMYREGFFPFSITEIPSSVHMQHRHWDEEIFYIRRGSLTLVLESSELEYGKNAKIVITPNCLHKVIIGSQGASVIWSRGSAKS